MEKHLLRGKRIHLRTISVEDATPRYCAWLNDPLVNQYLESRYSVQTVDSIREFIAATLANKSERMFAICMNETGEHIGNVKLTPIVVRHGTSDIGVVIGERQLWRQGFATEAIRLAVQFGFGELGLQKLGAGCYAEDEPCARAFERAGFKREGLLREQVYFGEDKRRTGVIRLGLLRSEAAVARGAD